MPRQADSAEVSCLTRSSAAVVRGRGRRPAAATRNAGLEGIVAKRLDAPYAEERRTGAAVKLKHWRRERVAVSAWRPGGRGELDTYYLRYPDGAYAGETRFDSRVTQACKHPAQ